MRRWLLVLVSFALAVGASAYVVASTWPRGGGARVWLPAASHLLALLAMAMEVLWRARSSTAAWWRPRPAAAG